MFKSNILEKLLNIFRPLEKMNNSASITNIDKALAERLGITKTITNSADLGSSIKLKGPNGRTLDYTENQSLGIKNVVNERIDGDYFKSELNITKDKSHWRTDMIVDGNSGFSEMVEVRKGPIGHKDNYSYTRRSDGFPPGYKSPLRKFNYPSAVLNSQAVNPTLLKPYLI